MATADQAVAMFDSLVGITETPPHSNSTPIGREFGWNGVAWCAETCSVVLKRIGQPGFWTASVAQAIADAKAGKNGLQWIDKHADIRAGDFVTYDWAGKGNPSDFHIAMVRDPGTQAKFQTDGGNENDSVMQQWRDRTYVQGFIRPAYAGTTPTPTGDLTVADIEAILAKLDDVIAILTESKDRDPGVKPIVQAIRKELADTSAKVDKVAVKVGA